MCRLLTVLSRAPVDVRHHLDAFTRVCRNSREYQGHGWGYAVLRTTGWERYRTITAIWDDQTRPEGDVRLLVAHARSAFRDEGIVVENNMPFVEDDRAFIFNGELHGVRLPVAGRTGAERLFHFLRQPAVAGTPEAVGRALAILRARTAHIRACNIIIASPRAVIVSSEFAGEADYFTLHRREIAGELVICSAPYQEHDPAWIPMNPHSVEVVPCSF